jgi:hypothetical protein
MCTHENTPHHTAPDTPTYGVDTHGAPGPDGRPPVTARVTAALDEQRKLISEVLGWHPGTNADRAARDRVLALLAARRAGWWSVLLRHVRADLSTPLIYAVAARAARNEERNRARFWRECAQDWQARADQRPTSDAAGALSNWHELGVTA